MWLVIIKFLFDLLAEVRAMKRKQHSFFLSQSEDYRNEDTRNFARKMIKEANNTLPDLNTDLTEAKKSGDKKKITGLESKIEKAQGELEWGNVILKNNGR